jgi:FAD synthase
MTLPQKISGTTKRFSGNGRKLGYPTANISAQNDLADGVYFGFADLKNYHKHPALIFIGTPTTVGDTVRRVEAHLLDAIDKNYYDQQLQLTVEYFYRPNQTLTTVEELVKILRKDERAARQWFLGHKRLHVS